MSENMVANIDCQIITKNPVKEFNHTRDKTSKNNDDIICKTIQSISSKKKIPTDLCSLNFVNKRIEDINASKIFQMKIVIDSFPFNLQNHGNIPVTV